MSRRYARFALLSTLVFTSVQALAADDTLGAAYAAILRGDTEAGQATVDRILKNGPDVPEAHQAADWLDSYRQVVASRTELKAKTFAWNVEQAQKALGQGKTFLALTFAAQAAAYAADPDQFSGEQWIGDLTQKCKAAAVELAQSDHWTKALNYYMLLERIDPKDEAIRDLREEATHHARIELTYKDEKALRERIQGVDRKLVTEAIKMISRLYYKEPDFKKAAVGALDNLLTLAGTTKLYKFLDGLANPALRDHFVCKLKDLRSEVDSAKSYTYRDLQRVFNQVKDENEVSISLPEGLLDIEFIEGVTRELDDYTDVIWPADGPDFDKMMMGGFEGVGIQLTLDEHSNRLKVVTPLEDSPALEKGVEPDDLIIAVDGKSTKGWTTEDAVRNIMGKKGTDVVLSILRPSTGQEIAYKLTRRAIVITTVRGVRRIPGDPRGWDYLLDKETGVAFIRLTGFHPESQQELSRALEQARAQGMKGLVLDVRHNPGGLLEVVVDTVSDFLDEGKIVTTKGRDDSETREPTPGKALYKDLPLVVLVNEGSASASEILAGALKDHHRAVVLGERTFGKGSVQHVRPLSDTAARIKLTTALYYLPSGRTPHRAPRAETWGVDPDWELKLTPKEFRRVLERERDTFIIHNEKADDANKALSKEEQQKILAEAKADNKEDEDGTPLLSDAEIKLLEADPYEAPKTDPQLETALLLIRVKLAANIPWPRELASAVKKDQP